MLASTGLLALQTLNGRVYGKKLVEGRFSVCTSMLRRGRSLVYLDGTRLGSLLCSLLLGLLSWVRSWRGDIRGSGYVLDLLRLIRKDDSCHEVVP